MTDSVQIALIVLLALLVGALLPLLLSAFALMKQARKALVLLEGRSDTLTVKTDQVLARVDRIAQDVQKELPTLQRTSQRVDQLGDSIERLTETVHKVQAAGKILGPAIAAGLNAYRLVKSGQQEQPPGAPPGAIPDAAPGAPADPDALPEAVTDAILAEIKAKAEAEANAKAEAAGDLPAPSDTDEAADSD